MMTHSNSLRWIALLCLLVAVLWLTWRNSSSDDDHVETVRQVSRRESSLGRSGGASRKDRPREFASLERWRGVVESALGDHEAGRSKIIARKQTVDSELYLLAVEAPSEPECAIIREKLDRLLDSVPKAQQGAAADVLAGLIRDYDPYGKQGRRVIQIDVPDEPNGRLTGFTCDAPDIDEMARRFRDGEMTNLANLRGYAADYAGMPLKRFDALLVED